MKNKFVLTLTIIILSFSLSGCLDKEIPEETRVPKEPPEIKINIENREIDYVIGKNAWNSIDYDREDTFKTILNDNSDYEIQYIEFDKEVVIDFKGFTPDKIKILDVLLKEDGSNRWRGKGSIEEIIPEIKDGVISFKIVPHIGVHLSSNLNDYGKKAAIRGFRIVTSWENNECEYSFIIRTDGK